MTVFFIAVSLTFNIAGQCINKCLLKERHDSNIVYEILKSKYSLILTTTIFFKRSPVCSIIHDHQTAARMLTPVTANSKPRKAFSREFTVGQGWAAWYNAAPTTWQVQQHRSLSRDHLP